METTAIDTSSLLAMTADTASERLVVGTALGNPEASAELAAVLSAADFTDPTMSRIWAAIPAAAGDMMVIHQGSGVPLSELGALAVQSPGLPHLARQAAATLRELRKRRDLLRTAGDLLEAAADTQRPTAGIVESFNAAVSAMGTAGGRLPELVNAAAWLAPAAALPAPKPILTDFLDAGGKMLVAGPSKARKSFFVLELSARLAMGTPEFLTLKIPGPRRVLCIQPEITAAHYQRRLARVVKAIVGPDADPPACLADRLAILNCRGADLCHALAHGALADLARQHRADVVVIDPVYKLLEEGTEDSADFRALLAGFDRLAERTGAAVIYVHHYAKGTAGDRDTIDRGAGSGWLGRDMDAGLYLDTHDTEPDALVLSAICRNYLPREPATIRYDIERGAFALLADVDAVVRTSRSNGRRQAAPDAAGGIPEEKAMGIFSGGPLPATEVDRRLGEMGTRLAARAAKSMLLQSGRLVAWRLPHEHGEKLMGTPEQIAELQSRFARPAGESEKSAASLVVGDESRPDSPPIQHPPGGGVRRGESASVGAEADSPDLFNQAGKDSPHGRHSHARAQSTTVIPGTLAAFVRTGNQGDNAR